MFECCVCQAKYWLFRVDGWCLSCEQEKNRLTKEEQEIWLVAVDWIKENPDDPRPPEWVITATADANWVDRT